MKSVLIIGLGRFGLHMAKTFIAEGNDVLAVEKDEVRADNAIDVVQDIQIADATSEMFIKSLGVRNFDICVVAVSNNFQSVLEITVLLKDCGAKMIIARANTLVHQKLLLRNGADHVVYAEGEIAERLAMKYGADNIFDYIELTPEFAIYEIAIPESWLGRSIRDLAIRVKYNISILAIKVDEKIQPLPNPDHIFVLGETIMVMGNHNDIKKLTR